MNNNNQPKPYTLYISNYCNYCKELLNNINKSNVRDQIQYIIIDRTPQNQPVIPPYITSVPTLIVQGQPRPLVGESVFQWLEKIQTQQSNENGPNPWHGQEMGQSYSDSYSFLEDKDSIPHHFSYLGNSSQSNQINTPQDSQDNQQQPQDELSQRMEMLQSQRDNEVQSVQRI